VDPKPQRLKRTSRRMMARFIGRKYGTDDTGEASRGYNRRLRAGRHDSARHAAGGTFLAQLKQEIGEIALREGVDQGRGGQIGAVGGRRCPLWPVSLWPIPLWPIPLWPVPLWPVPLWPIPLWPIPLSPTISHAHIQGAITLERKSPRRIIDLERGDADIENNAVQRVHPGLGQQGQHVAKAAVRQMQPARVLGCQAGTAGDRRFIALDRPDMALGAVEDRPRITAAAECAIQIHRPVARVQWRQPLGQ